MKSRFWLFIPGVILAAAAVRGAAGPAGNQRWSNEQLNETARTLPAKMSKVKVAFTGLAAWGNHSMSILHREGDGQAELHETENDVLFIRSGEGSFILGGRIPDGKPTTAHEIRGSKIVGGERFPLHAGDVIHVSAGTAHQFLVEPGHQMDYVAVKVHQ